MDSTKSPTLRPPQKAHLRDSTISPTLKFNPWTPQKGQPKSPTHGIHKKPNPGPPQKAQLRDSTKSPTQGLYNKPDPKVQPMDSTKRPTQKPNPWNPQKAQPRASTKSPTQGLHKKPNSGPPQKAQPKSSTQGLQKSPTQGLHTVDSAVKQMRIFLPTTKIHPHSPTYTHSLASLNTKNISNSLLNTLLTSSPDGDTKQNAN
ncbi:hypothetical protein Bpfe_022943 [Biomphalaria pfeifferi]|uniref:Uncharacterized protein n=1 Tax=Biomphalaria pfeifferi TaxID=112525 RepID=A0AAD8B417_BIOPF|nr:hypothetical protein Bpfe_022943 [Biomphalaria pfeifferi]